MIFSDDAANKIADAIEDDLEGRPVNEFTVSGALRDAIDAALADELPALRERAAAIYLARRFKK